jgi:multiple sugar transport system permease protein
MQEDRKNTDKQADPVVENNPRRYRNLYAHILLAIFALACVVPFIWMLLTSLKTEPEATILDNFHVFPEKWQWGNFRTLFEQHPMAVYYLNSSIYTILRSLPALFLASLTGFVIAKYSFRARGAMWVLIIATLIIPFQLRLIPMANMLFGMGLKNEYWAVVLPGILDPFGIFLFIQACKSIPDELLESARIDGCGIWRQYIHVALPLIGPTLAAYAIILFMWSWGEFLWSFIVITETARMPLEVGIKGFSGEHYSTLVHMMAAATIAVIPVVVVFLLLQRQFVRGVTMSGLKG